MIRMNLKTKIIVMNALVIIPLLVIMVVLILFGVEEYSLNRVKSQLLNESYEAQTFWYTQLSERNMGIQTDSKLQFLIYELSNKLEKRVQISYKSSSSENYFYEALYNERGIKLNNDSNILEYDSEGFKLAFDEKKNYEIMEKNNKKYFAIYFPLYNRENLVGAGSLIYPLKNEYILISQLRKNNIYIIGLILTGMLLLLLSFTNKIINPIRYLTNIMKNYRPEQDLNTIPITSGDEIEELSIAFKHMSNEINNLVEDLKKERDKQKSFFDNMTHEIRTPLTNIMGYTDILKRVDDIQKTKCLNHVSREANRLLRMVNDLLERSRLGYYEIDLQKEECNLKKLVLETLSFMEYKLHNSGIKIETDLENTKILIDRDRIKEVLLNLIDNVIKHSSTEKIEIKLSNSKDGVEISIKDYGIGMSEEVRENSFLLPSQKGNDSLGMIIVRKIIDLHKGQIKIDSKINYGTETKIFLPYLSEN